MPEFSLLATFALTVLVLELTPGPNMAWLAVLSASEGRKAGLAAVAGVALGLLAIGAAAAAGLTALVTGSPTLFEALRWAGALYLLWLAWEGWREAGESSPARLGASRIRHFRHGFVINALNPKAGLFYIAVLPDFMRGEAPEYVQAIGLTAISVLIATAVHLAIIALAGTAQRWMEDRRTERRVRRVLAILLVLIAIWLFLSTGAPPAGG